MENKLPHKPGVYLFKDFNNTIIYIGKATNLKSRVSSYFNTQKRDWKVDSLVAEHQSIEHIVTSTEIEASLLEAHLIRLYQPKYNVLLKDGDPFVYFLFKHTQVPDIKLVRNQQEKGVYFGPFLHKRPARSAFNYLVSTFKLNRCNKKINNGCLDYHLGTCAGNCRPDFDLDGYRLRMKLAETVLKKDHAACLTMLQEHIQDCVARQDFEQAQQMHEYMTNLDTIFATLALRFSPDKYAAQVSAATIGSSEFNGTKLAAQMQEFLGLDHPVITIDCFDISHFQSSELVGSCIRFTYGIPDTHNFRRFKIKTLSIQNDYKALAEIVSRRYKDPKNIPDVILIDGGKGQLHAVRDIMPNAHCISLAKKEELLFCPRYTDGIHLDVHTNVGKLCIALRDYAHHFAIEYHRKRKTKLV